MHVFLRTSGAVFNLERLTFILGTNNLLWSQYRRTSNMEIEKEWLEAVLKRRAYDDTPINVIDLEPSEDIVGRGDNCLSVVRRVKAKVLLGSGRVKTVSLIVKKQHETEHMRKFCEDTGVFFKEICMYRDVLPKMETVLEEAGDVQGVFWAHCYDIRLYDRLVFEDLTVSGYKMADRKKQLGLDAAVLVLRTLAKFHALSRILLDRGEIPLGIFKQCNFLKNPDNAQKWVDNNMRHLADTMKGWGDEWKEAVQRLTKGRHTLGQKYLDAIIPDPHEFVVLCYFDCWTNNVLFRGDDLEHPTSMKFVDFQLSYLSSPACDLRYFLLTSVRLEVREKHFDLLLRTYYESLKSVLTKCRYEGVLPSLADVTEAFDKRAVLDLLNTAIVAAMTRNQEDVPDLEVLMQEEKEALDKGEKSPHSPFLRMSAPQKSIIQAAIKSAINCEII